MNLGGGYQQPNSLQPGPNLQALFTALAALHPQAFQPGNASQGLQQLAGYAQNMFGTPVPHPGLVNVQQQIADNYPVAPADGVGAVARGSAPSTLHLRVPNPNMRMYPTHLQPILHHLVDFLR